VCRRQLVTRVAGFDDALFLARDIHRYFGPAEVVTVVNCAGGVVDTYALHPVAADVSDLAAIGRAIAGIRPGCLVLCLVSSRPRGGAAVLSEEDVDLWHELYASCAEEGIHLADWLVIDGQVIRSMTLSCSSDADWSLRPPDDDR
jgi:hypothetical protein